MDNFYWEEHKALYFKVEKQILLRPVALFFIGVIISMTIPTVTENVGFIFFYPLYGPTWM